MKSSLLKIAHLYTYVGYHGIAGHCQLLTYIFYAGRYTMIPAEMHPLLPVLIKYDKSILFAFQ